MVSEIDLEHIYIFKTNINNTQDHAIVKTLLDSNSDITEWNVDMEDIDKVLRVKSDVLNCDDIIVLVNHAGFICGELS